MKENGAFERRNTDSFGTKLLKIISNKYLLLICLLFIKVLYDWLAVKYLDGVYYPSVTRDYGIDMNFGKLLQGYAAYILVIFIYTRTSIIDYFTKTIVTLLLVLYYMPINSSYYLNNMHWAFFVSSHIYLLLTASFTIGIAKLRYSKRRLTKVLVCRKYECGILDEKKDKTAVQILCWISAAFCLALIGYKLSYNGLGVSLNISGDYVYSTREAFLEDVMAQGAQPITYFVSFIRAISSSASLFLICSSLYTKKYYFTAIGVMTTLSEYSLATSKSSLLFIGIIVIVLFMSKLNLIEKYNEIFVIGIVFLLVISAESRSIHYLIPRRIFYIPSWLNTLYYSFFIDNPKLLWTQDAVPFKWFLNDAYSLSLHELINNAFFLGRTTSPNTGMFAEAFMHFGFYGVLIYPLLLSLIINWFSITLGSFGNTMSVLFATKVALSLTNVPITRIDFVLKYFVFSVIIYIIRCSFPKICRKQKRS